MSGAGFSLFVGFIDGDHFIGVAVVGSNDGAASCSCYGFEYASQGDVGGFNGFDDSLEVASVSYHVGVGKVDETKLVLLAGNEVAGSLGDLGSLHGWSIGKRGDFVGSNQSVGFLGEGFTTPAVEKEGYMGKFLGLCHTKLPQPQFS